MFSVSYSHPCDLFAIFVRHFCGFSVEYRSCFLPRLSRSVRFSGFDVAGGRGAGAAEGEMCARVCRFCLIPIISGVWIRCLLSCDFPTLPALLVTTLLTLGFY